MADFDFFFFNAKLDELKDLCGISWYVVLACIQQCSEMIIFYVFLRLFAGFSVVFPCRCLLLCEVLIFMRNWMSYLCGKSLGKLF